MVTEAPVVIGTSLLTGAGKSKTSAASVKSTAADIAQNKVSAALKTLLSGSSGTGETLGQINASAGMPALQSLAQINAAQPATTPPLTAAQQAVGQSSTTAAEHSVDSQAGIGGTPAGFTPLQFAAAMAMARQRLGGPNLSGFGGELSAVQQQAATQSSQATHQGRQAEADDAILYGHLGNYVQQLARQGTRTDNQQTRAAGANFTDALNAERSGSNKGQAAVAAADQARGIAPSPGLSQSKTDQAFETAQTRNNKADSLGQMHSGNASFNRIMDQTRADVATTGTGKVADEKSALNNTLASIASALATQAASIGASKASAQNSYQSQLHSLAAQLQTASDAQNPNLPANQLIGSEVAKNDAAALKSSQAPVVAGAPNTTKQGKIATAESYLEGLNPQNGGIPSAHDGTLVGIIQNMLSAGNGKTGNGNIFLNDEAPLNPNNYSKTRNALAQAIANRKGQGYTNADLQALWGAYDTILGK